MRRFSLRAVLFLAICIAAFAYATAVPAVVASSAPPTAFSAERAMTHVRAIAARPHPIGSTEHRAVADYIATQLQGMGLSPQVQEATGIGTRYPSAGRVRNIVVRVPGTAGGAGPAVLLMAHYDAVPAAPGAGDDASGSAVLLETLRALRASPPLRHDVIALFADGEETGLLGAAAFVREHPWARDVAVTMNFEARGTHGPSLMFETGAGNLDVVRALRRVGGARATSLSTFVYRQLPNDTDLSETARLEKPALNFAFIGGVNRYHTAQDDVAHLDPRSVQDHGESALGLARELAGNPLPRKVTPDAVFFDLPLAGLVAYPESWAPAFALLLLVPLAVAIAGLRRRHPRWMPQLLMGTAGAVLSVGLAVVAAVLIARALAALHAALGSGAPTHAGVYVALVAVVSLTIASVVYSVCRRWSPREPLQAGGAVFFALLALTTSFIAPAVSFVFVWPALAVLIALALHGTSPASEAALWLATALAIVILLPLAWLMGAVALGLDATGAAAVAAFTALGAWLLVHVLEMVDDKPWLTATVGAAVALVLFASGAATVRTGEKHPVGSSFGYGVDADSNSAYFGMQASTRGALAALEQGMAKTPRIRPPAWFGRYFAASRPAPAPGAAIRRGRVELLGDSTRADTSWVRVRVIPAPGARAVSLRADSGVVLGAAIDGRAVATDGYRYLLRGRWQMEFAAPPDEGFEVAFAVAPAKALTLTLVTHRPGIAPVPGLEIPERPAGIIPIQRGDYTLIHQRVRVR